MSTYQREIVINEIPKRLFEYVTEQDNLPAWSPQVIKSEVKGGGPIEKGSILIQTRKQGNRTMTSEVEVIRHDPPNCHAVVARMMGVTATFNFEFEDKDGATKLTMTGDVKGKGLGIFVAPLLKMMMEKGDDKVLENLKKVIERN